MEAVVELQADHIVLGMCQLGFLSILHGLSHFFFIIAL